MDPPGSKMDPPPWRGQRLGFDHSGESHPCDRAPNGVASDAKPASCCFDREPRLEELEHEQVESAETGLEELEAAA